MVVDAAGTLIAGHAMTAAARKLGWTHVAAAASGLTGPERTAYAVADNRTGDAEVGSRFAAEPLAVLLADLQRQDDTLLAAAGFTADEAAGLLPRDDGPDAADAPLAAAGEPSTRPGDLIVLGDHRLLCADCRNPEAVARLLDGDAPAMIWTDPPYGVSYQAASGKFDRIRNDDLTGDALINQLLIPALRLAVEHASADAAAYIWYAQSSYAEFARAAAAVGLDVLQTIIWAKGHHVQSWADYQCAHEPCLYCARAGRRPPWHGGRDQTSLWRFALADETAAAVALGPGLVIEDGRGNRVHLSPTVPPRKLRRFRVGAEQSLTVLAGGSDCDTWEVSRDHQPEHPTQKPVELARRPMLNSSRPGDVVYDPFGGSGACILAAEMTGRKARACELECGYCDVIIRRWRKHTGREAEVHHA